MEDIDATSIDNLTITNNNSLSFCDIESICQYLINPGGNISIFDNALGCATQQEVEDACGIVGIENINEVENTIIFFPNPVDKELFIAGLNGNQILEVNIFNQMGQKIFYEKEHK